MNAQIKNCPSLTERDIDFLYQVESGLAIVADVSRADILLCGLLSPQRAIVLQHIEPESISSHYRENTTGRIYQDDEQSLIFRALLEGSSGKRQRQILSSGAPVIQDVQPIRNAVGNVIGTLVIETNMIENERHRRRDRNFRRVIRWLQEMGVRGEIENPGALRRFGPYNGIYFVGPDRELVYISGIATNMFRSIGRLSDMRGQDVSVLEKEDALLVDQAFDAHRCVELRNEYDDGRIWIRGAIPIHTPVSYWQNRGARLLNSLWLRNRTSSPSSDSGQTIDGALVLVHNATEAIRRERELNVKSAIIQEVHHRVKNNLQTIAAMLRIQARRSQNEETQQLLSDAVNRILSMSVIHEFLSQDEHQPINIRDVCQRIVTQVAQVAVGPEQRIDIQVTGPNVRLPAGQATPTAMVVNELLLNAMEHGLNGRQNGNLLVQLMDLGNAVEIRVLDDGNGLPDDFNTNQPSTLGLQIVHTLVTDDLKGQFAMIPTDADVGTPVLEERATNGSQPRDTQMREPLSEAALGHYNTQAIVTFPKRSLKVD